MQFSGFQKLTLLDYPGYIACTLFVSNCNFRCLFCHNSQLVNDCSQEHYDEQEILQFLSARKGKLDGVCISGGEPLLQREIVDFIKKVKELGFLVKIDTNGSNFEVLEYIIKNRLCDYVAMDIKNSLQKYNKTCDVSVDLQAVQNSIRLIMQSGVDYEFRTTVVNELHESGDFVEIAKLIGGAKAYYLQGFKDSGNVLKKGLTEPTAQKMQEFLSVVKGAGIKNAFLRGIEG